MIRRLIHCAPGAATLFCVGATDPPAYDYMVEATITDGGTVVAHPVVRVAPGKVVSYQFGEHPGTSCAMSVVVTPRGDGIVDTQWHVDALSHGNRRAFDPRVTVRERQISSIAYGAAADRIAVRFTVTPVAISRIPIH